MSFDLVIILAVIIACFFLLLFIINKRIEKLLKAQEPGSDILEWLKSTNKRLDDQNRQFTSTLQLSTRTLNERLDNSARFIAKLQKSIGEMSEIGRGMKELQEFLRSPKLRGNIGEQILKELLSQMLPKQTFHLQYTFKSGATVDAAIETTSGIIPVDSKFPMEGFRRILGAKESEQRKKLKREFEKDVKKHIDDISKKYILTEEGTIDYALMYLPSESIYYELVNNPSLFDYSAAKRVLPVSPMTFYAYLRAILMSFEGQKIEKQAKKILQTIRAAQKDYLKAGENLGILSRHVNNAYNQMNNVARSFALLGQKLESTQKLEEVEEKKEFIGSNGDSPSKIKTE